MDDIFDRLFIFEMANNHMGDVDHGIKMIEKFAETAKKYPFKFAFKFQYRDLDTFIHPDYKSRMDIKYVKRFTETRLTEEDFIKLKRCASENGFITACTPFDEISVEKIEAHGFDVLKIASCSLTDWPLLERISENDLPVIASTAGASLDEIDKVVSFFKHRNRKFALMHCVGSYPTPAAELELNQIPFFQERYSDVPIGYSTHESPDEIDPIKMAVAMGAEIFERHVALPTDEYAVNAYSSTPEQVDAWLEAALAAYEKCGVRGKRRVVSEKEKDDLTGLRRGVFAKRDISESGEIEMENLFFAIPCSKGQILANDLSKYVKLTSSREIREKAPLTQENVTLVDNRDKILDIVKKISALLKKSGTKLSNQLDLELSHHYGIDEFERWGCSMINCVNREYCKKIIMLLPGQENPTHYHKKKEETFHILHGDVQLELAGETKNYSAGDLVVVERGVKHSFSSTQGAVFEEISTTHFKNDSFYDDPAVGENPFRKTAMTFWADWLMGDFQ